MSVVLNIPDPDDPGFLKRQEAVFDLQILSLEAMADIQELQDAENYRAMAEAMKKAREAVTKQVDFIVNYVVEPEDRDEARKAIRELSRDELRKVMNRIREGTSEDAENPTE